MLKVVILRILLFELLSLRIHHLHLLLLNLLLLRLNMHFEPIPSLQALLYQSQDRLRLPLEFG